MGKAEFGTPKDIANRMKAKGLQKLRWYCQMCEKQCRDENGFKCHCASESHQRQMLLFRDNPNSILERNSREFKAAYLRQLSRSHGTKRVFANKVYQEMIGDRHHLHMNATKWGSLTEFITYLGRQGYCHVEDTDKGWYITWIDNSPEALARKAAILKKERSEMSFEERQRKLLKEQIERAKEGIEDKEIVEEKKELKRDNEEEPLKLVLNVKKEEEKKPAVGGFKKKDGFKKAFNSNAFKPMSLSALAKQSQTDSKIKEEVTTKEINPSLSLNALAKQNHAEAKVKVENDIEKAKSTLSSLNALIEKDQTNAKFKMENKIERPKSNLEAIVMEEKAFKRRRF